MPPVTDFRTAAFAAANVDTCGKFIGRSAYWKLYVIENFFRVIVHSVLSVQIGPDWWIRGVHPKLQERAQDLRREYMAKPWHSQPGKHDIYFTTLSQLNEIIRANSHLMQALIPDIDQWILKVEQIRLPRNVVGHMNFPITHDRQRIDVLYADCRALVTHLQQQNILLKIP